MNAIEMVSYFLYGAPKQTTFRALKNDCRRRIQARGEEAPGEHNEPLWSMGALVKKANAVLKAMGSKDEDWIERISRRNGYAVTRQDWVEFRFHGPFCLHDKGLLSRDINLSLGLPNGCFYAMIMDKNIDDSDTFDVACFMLRRLTHAPCGFLVEPDAVGIYEFLLVGMLSKGANESRSLGTRRIVWISKDGQAHWAKRLMQTSSRIACRRPEGPKQRFTGGARRNIVYLPGAKKWADDRLENDDGKDLINYIAYAICAEQQANMNWRIRLSNAQGVVNFPVTIDEAGKLFSGRERVLASDGRRKRIIHWARAHNRKNGQNVRTHLRGARQFKWEDFDVEIILPGKHNDGRSLMHSSISEPTIAIPPRWIQMAGLSKVWAKTQEKHDIEGARHCMTNEYTGEMFDVYVCPDNADCPREIAPGQFLRGGSAAGNTPN